MKKQIFIPILLMFSIRSYSQETKEKHVDKYRNEGYFNITRFSYVNVNEAKLETFSPTNGVVVTELPINKATAYGLQTINGYFFNPYFSAGIGIGLDGYSNPNFNTIPVFIDLRLYFDDNPSSMYTYMDLGTLIKIKNGTKRGRMFNIGVGYKIALNKKRVILVTDIGYSFKQVSFDGQTIKKSDDKLLIKGLMLSLGIIF